MTLPERYDLTIEQGATLKRWFRLTYPTGTIVDLTAAGYDTARLTIRDEYGGDEIVALTTANGGVSVVQEADADGAEWSGYLYLSAASTAALTDWGDGAYDLEIDNGSDVIRVLQGVATLSPEATT